MKLLPTFHDPFYQQQILLDGVNYTFVWKYNQRENTWRFTVLDVDNTVLASGVKVVCETDLLVRYVDPRLPPGILVAFSNTTDRSAPGLEDFGPGLRVELFYLTAAEINEGV